jgi:hypothetical protein
MLWVLNFFPDWFFHLILLGGIGILMFASVVTKFPGLTQYGLEFKIVALVLIVAGLLFEGALSLEKDYKVQQAQLQHELDLANAKSAQIVTKVVDQVVYRDKIITVQGTNTVTYIDKWHDAIDKGCVLSKEAIDGINKNAAAPLIEVPK